MGEQLHGDVGAQGSDPVAPQVVDHAVGPAFGTLLVAALLTGLANSLITAPFGATSWFAQAVVAAVATTITLPYGALVGVLLYLDLRARKETLTLETLRTDLQASAA